MVRIRSLIPAVCASAAFSARAAGESDLPPPPEVIARVGETIITRSDVEEASGDLLEKLLAERLGAVVEIRRRAKEAGKWTDDAEKQFVKLREAAAKEIPREGLEKNARGELLRRALVVEAARESHRQPDEVVVEWRVRTAVRKAGGVEEFERRTGRTVEWTKEDLRWSQLRDRFFIDLLPHGVMPGPAEAREYYRANRARMQKPPSVKLRVIELPIGPDREEALERADALRRELQFAPDRFEMRARDLAETEEEKARAGLVVDSRTGQVVEWIPLNGLPPPVARAIKDLKPGEVSDVVEIQGAFALVKLVDVKPAEPIPLEEVCEKIVRELQRAQQNATWRRWCDYYLRDVYIADGKGRRISAERFTSLAGGEACD